MKKLISIIVGVVLALIILGLLVLGSLGKFEKNVGSVEQGNDYHSTLIESGAAATSTQQIFTGSGTLGSVVITSSTGKFILMDWNNTTSTVSTTIAVFDNSVALGTYTFDRVVINGLMLKYFVTTTGNFVITHR